MKPRQTAIALLAAAAALLPPVARAQATNPSYLAQMPTPARVKAEVRGADALETAARQAAAFWHLIWIIRDLNGPRGVYRQVTPDAQRLINTYSSHQMWYSLKENAPPPQDSQRWVKLREFYENDPGFLDELLQQLFKPEFRAGYYRATGKQPPAARRGSAPPAASGTPPRLRPPASTLSDAEAADLEKKLGMQFHAAGEYAKAAENYRRAVTLNPALFGALVDAAFEEGLKYDDSGRHQEALPEFKLALALMQEEPRVRSAPSYKPPTYDHVTLYIGAGDTLLSLKQYPEALAAYRDALALKPVPGAYHGLGETYLAMEQYDKAVPALREALRLRPDNVAAHEQLGLAHYALEQYPEAEAALRQAVRLKPDRAVAHYGLGLSYLRMGRKDEALRVYRTLDALDKAAAKRLYDEINKAPRD